MYIYNIYICLYNTHIFPYIIYIYIKYIYIYTYNILYIHIHIYTSSKNLRFDNLTKEERNTPYSLRDDPTIKRKCADKSVRQWCLG